MVIYHYPKPLSSEAVVGSAVRPVRMREAFERIGEEVFDVTGDGAMRMKKARKLEQRLTSGSGDAIFYSESVNVPPALTWVRRKPWRMNFDYNLVRKMHDYGVPTSLFYRDIHWVLGQSKALGAKSFIKHRLTPAFARRELQHYERSLDVIFLPHKDMARYLPLSFPNTEMRSLPPGGILRPFPPEEDRVRKASGKLNLLYVGNIEPPIYDFAPYLEVLDGLDCARLQLVTRERALQFYGSYYELDKRRNISVSHAHGGALDPLYAHALKQECRRFGGDFSVLWHNNNLEDEESREFYTQLLKS